VHVKAGANPKNTVDLSGRAGERQRTRNRRRMRARRSEKGLPATNSSRRTGTPLESDEIIGLNLAEMGGAGIRRERWFGAL
jgi:hypothetical protein